MTLTNRMREVVDSVVLPDGVRVRVGQGSVRIAAAVNARVDVLAAQARLVEARQAIADALAAALPDRVWLRNKRRWAGVWHMGRFDTSAIVGRVFPRLSADERAAIGRGAEP